jgi:hypothetical protein
MHKKKIEITIDPTGDVKLETSGFQGRSCTQETQPISKALFGQQPTVQQLKPEYHQHTPKLRELE